VFGISDDKRPGTRERVYSPVVTFYVPCFASATLTLSLIYDIDLDILYLHTKKRVSIGQRFQKREQYKYADRRDRTHYHS